MPTLTQQAATAYANDMGVSSPMFPEPDGTAEIDEATMKGAALYTQTLAVPRRDRWDEPEVRHGEALFVSTGCAACHVEELRTGAHEVSALVDQTIHPYTDLLCTTWASIWRTDVRTSSPPAPSGVRRRCGDWAWRKPCFPMRLLARRTRAIDRGGDPLARGEAEHAKETFRTLPASDRQHLLAFLRAL